MKKLIIHQAKRYEELKVNKLDIVSLIIKHNNLEGNRGKAIEFIKWINEQGSIRNEFEFYINLLIMKHKIKKEETGNMYDP